MAPRDRQWKLPLAWDKRQAAGKFPPPLALLWARQLAMAQLKEKYDVVVIGSGFGGAITAHRLAQAGRSVLVLEQGRRWKPREFPRSVRQVGGAFWRDLDGANRRTGFLEYRAFKRIDVVQGVGVGGGSLHYFNVHIRAPERIFRGWPSPLTRAVLEPYYDQVQAKLESKPLVAPDGRQLPPRTLAFCEAARRTGATARLVDIAVYTGPDRLNEAQVRQSACNYCGDCMLGCHLQSKNTLDITYIAEAEARYGAEVAPLHKVSHLAPEAGGYRIFYDVVGEQPEGARQEGRPRRSVLGKQVILAAGSLGSTEILLRCRDVFRTLPDLGRRLGHGFSGNGDMLFAGAMDVPLEHGVDPAVGPSITAVADCSTEQHAIHIEDLGYPDQMLWLIEGLIPPQRNRLLQYLQLAGRYLKRSLGLGSTHSRVSDEIGSLLEGGRTSRFLPYLGMGSDAADGQLRLRKGALDIDWRHTRSRAMFREMERSMKQLSESIQGRHVTSFLWQWPMRKLLTAHPLGGCPMGERPADSVVDHRGSVWSYPNLYVVDGATLPSALSVNPSLTIAAVAERSAHWMQHGRERTVSPRPLPLAMTLSAAAGGESPQI
jgi:cholesterol oxidase